MQQHRSLMSQLIAPSILLIGAEDYAKLMNEVDISTQMITFDVMSLWRNQSVLGLRVVVVPWMRGLVVMPESILTR